MINMSTTEWLLSEKRLFRDKAKTDFCWFQDMNKMTPDKIEIATLRRVNGKTVISIMGNEEMSLLIKKFEDAEKAAEETKRLKEALAKGDGKPWRIENLDFYIYLNWINLL